MFDLECKKKVEAVPFDSCYQNVVDYIEEKILEVLRRLKIKKIHEYHRMQSKEVQVGQPINEYECVKGLNTKLKVEL